METVFSISDIVTAMTGAGTLIAEGFKFLKGNPALLIPMGISMLSAVTGWVYSRVH